MIRIKAYVKIMFKRYGMWLLALWAVKGLATAAILMGGGEYIKNLFL